MEPHVVARLAFATILLRVMDCQTVKVSVKGVSSELGSDAVLSCLFSVSPPTGNSFGTLVWSKGIGASKNDIASFVSETPIYTSGYDEKYIAARNDSVSTLTISNVTHEDAGKYLCHVEFQDSSLNPLRKETSGELFVKVSTKSENVRISYEGTQYRNGDSINVTAGNDHQFNCTATGITPAATFVWSLSDGSTNPPNLLGAPSETHTQNPTDALLVDSTSTIPVNIPKEYKMLTLTCQANNTDDESSRASIDVTLQIQEVEQPSSGLGTGAIIGIAAGGAVVVIVIVGGGIFCWYKKKHQ